MTPSDCQRLAAILGMLGSEHVGERAAAGLQAEAFRKKHGLTWAELLTLSTYEPEPEPQPPSPAPAPPPPSPLSPRYEPEQRNADRLYLNVFTVVFAVAVGVLGILLTGSP